MDNSESQQLFESGEQSSQELSLEKRQRKNWQLLFLLSGIGFIVELCRMWISGIQIVLQNILIENSRIAFGSPLNFDSEDRLKETLRIMAPLIAGLTIALTNRRQTLMISCFLIMFSEFLINLGFKYSLPTEQNNILGFGFILYLFGYDMIIVTLAVMVGQWFEKSYATVAFGMVWVFANFGGGIALDWVPAITSVTKSPLAPFYYSPNISLIKYQIMITLILCIIVFFAAALTSQIDKQIQQEASRIEPKFKFKDLLKFKLNDLLIIIGISLVDYQAIYVNYMYKELQNPMNISYQLGDVPLSTSYSVYFLPATQIFLFTFMFLPFYGYIIDILGHQQYFLMINSVLTIIGFAFYQSIECTGNQILTGIDCNNETKFGFPIFMSYLTYFLNVSVLIPAFLLLGQRVLFPVSVGIIISLSNMIFFVIGTPDNLQTLYIPFVISAVAIFILSILDLQKEQKLTPSQKYDIIDCSKACFCNQICE